MVEAVRKEYLQILHKIEDFSGGLNERDSNSLVKDNECVYPTQNITLSRRGAIEPRPGTGKYLPLPVTEEGDAVTGAYSGILQPQTVWRVGNYVRRWREEDAQRVLRHAVGLAKLGEKEADDLDVNKDGVVNVADAILMLQGSVSDNDATKREDWVDGGCYTMEDARYVKSVLADPGKDFTEIEAQEYDVDKGGGLNADVTMLDLDMILEGQGRGGHFHHASDLAHFLYEKTDTAILVPRNETVIAAANLLASALDAPLLVTGKYEVPERTMQTLLDLGVKKVYIVGGENLIATGGAYTNTDVENSLQIITGKQEMPEPGSSEFELHDANKDGKIDVNDTIVMLRGLSDGVVAQLTNNTVRNFEIKRIVHSATEGDVRGVYVPQTLEAIAAYVKDDLDTELDDACFLCWWNEGDRAGVASSLIGGERRPLFAVGPKLTGAGFPKKLPTAQINLIKGTYGAKEVYVLGQLGKASGIVSQLKDEFGEDKVFVVPDADDKTTLQATVHAQAFNKMVRDIPGHEEYRSHIVTRGGLLNGINGALAGLLGAKTRSLISYLDDTLGSNGPYSYIPQDLEDFFASTVGEGSRAFIVGLPASNLDEMLYDMMPALPAEEILLAAAGTSLKRWDYDGCEWVTVYDDFAQGARMEFLAYRNSVYMVNGADGYFRFGTHPTAYGFRVERVTPYNPTEDELEDLGGNHIPADARFIDTYYERILLAGGKEKKRIYISDIGVAGDDPESPFKMFRPDYFPDMNIYDIRCQKGEELTGVVVYKDSYFVFTDKSISVIHGNTLPFALRLLRSDIGCVAHRSIVEYGGILYFLSRDGPVAFDGSRVFRLYEKIPTTTGKIDRKRWSEACAVVHDNSYKLTVAETGAETMTLEYDLFNDLYDEERQKAMIPHRGFNPTCWITDSDNALIFGGPDGYLREYSRGYDDDDGIPFEPIYTTKAFGAYNNIRYRKARVRMDAARGWIDLLLRVDFKDWERTALDMKADYYEGGGLVTSVATTNKSGELIQFQLRRKDESGKFCIHGIIVEAMLKKITDKASSFGPDAGGDRD